MTYITAIHVPVAGLALLPLLLGLPPLLLPAHVVLTEMVIDPVCSLAFEGAPEDPDVMKRPPRGAAQSLIGWPLLLQGLVQGAMLLAGTLLIYVLALQHERPVDMSRTLAVVGLTVGNLLLVAVNATSGNGWRALFGQSARAFWAVSAVALAALAVALAVPAARHLLHFEMPALTDLGLSLLVVGSSVALGAWGASVFRGTERARVQSTQG